jgi:phosphoribosyl-dephospho-CoA transferase
VGRLTRRSWRRSATLCSVALGASTSIVRVAATINMGQIRLEEAAMMGRLIDVDIRSVLAEESTLSDETQGELLRALRKCSEPSDHVRALI